MRKFSSTGEGDPTKPQGVATSSAPLGGSVAAIGVKRVQAAKSRVLYRTIIVAAVVFLFFAILAVVATMSGSTSTAESKTRSAKAFILVVEGLAPSALESAMAAGKTPFMSLLSSSGSQYGRLAYSGPNDGSSPSTASSLAAMLTGVAGASLGSLGMQGNETFLRAAKRLELKPTIVAPSSLWSMPNATASPSAGVCPHIGLYDRECSGTLCPVNTSAAYCNAFRKYELCSGDAQLHGDDVVHAFNLSVRAKSDIVYVHLDAFAVAPPSADTGVAALAELARVQALDSVLARVSILMSERTFVRDENWLLVLTADGANAQLQAPFFVSAFSRGNQLILHNVDQKAGNVVDVYATVAHWLGMPFKSGKMQGICSFGATASSCRSS